MSALIRGYLATLFAQRFGSILNLHPHLHSIVPDGLFAPDDDGMLTFVELPPPTGDELERLLTRIARRLTRVVERHTSDDARTGALVEATASGLREALSTSVRTPRLLLDDEPPAPASPLCARVAGFTLHAAQWVSAEDRAGLERLCRYGLRSPFSQERLTRLEDGRVRYALRRPWPRRGGITELVLEPEERPKRQSPAAARARLRPLRRLAALTPSPYAHLVRHHGIFALRAKDRSRLPAPPAVMTRRDEAGAPTPSRTSRRARLPWAQLLMRVFSIDALRCPRCDHPMTVLALISDGPVVTRILTHLGLAAEPPARPTPCSSSISTGRWGRWRRSDRWSRGTTCPRIHRGTTTRRRRSSGPPPGNDHRTAWPGIDDHDRGAQSRVPVDRLTANRVLRWSRRGDSACHHRGVSRGGPAPKVADVRAAEMVKITNPRKVFWPDGTTKADLVAYYEVVAPLLLPYLRDRPVVLTRYPDGMSGKSFFQKDAPVFTPDWVRTETIYSNDTQRDIRYFVIDDAASLRYVANLGTIPIHVWSSRVPALGHPDWLVIDLDPKGAPFTQVVSVARTVRAILEELELPAFVKTSGATGLHILIPMGGHYTGEEVRTFARLLAMMVVEDVPDLATVTRAIRGRDGKVYVDFGQNGYGNTIVGPYSVRPLPGAPASCPLRWDEVTPRLDPAAFTIRTIPPRFQRMQDPMTGVLGEGIDMVAAIERIQRRMAGGGS